MIQTLEDKSVNTTITNSVFIKKPCQDAPIDPQSSWHNLKLAIDHIYLKNAFSLSFENLYKTAYLMVIQKHGQYLYTNLYETMHEHLSKVIIKLRDTPDPLLLGALNHAWEDHKISTHMIRDIMMYLNSVFTQLAHLPKIDEIGSIIFRLVILPIKSRVIKLLLERVAADRNNEVIDYQVLKLTISMFMEMGIVDGSLAQVGAAITSSLFPGSSPIAHVTTTSTSNAKNNNVRPDLEVYVTDFENDYLEDTVAYLQAESLHQLSIINIGQYLQWVEHCIAKELNRVTLCLDNSSENKVREVCEKELLITHVHTIMSHTDSYLVSIFKNDKYDELHRMYTLLARVPGNNNNSTNSNSGHQLMCSELFAYLKQLGMSIISDTENQPEQRTFIESLLTLYDKCNIILHKAFNDDKNFNIIFINVFDLIINESNRCSEYLSLFIDELLRKGLKGATDLETDRMFERIIRIFCHIKDKDIFEKYYKHHLARRLLAASSVSDDAERQMISKLKRECGLQFTSKLECMFTDIRLSAEMDKQFVEQLENAGGEPPSSDISVSVLTNGNWPIIFITACNLPMQIDALAQQYKAFYLSRYSGRHLNFQTNLGTADLKMLLPNKRKYELSVTTQQMVLLMQYNIKNTLSLSELVQQTSIGINEVMRSLMLLTNAKHPILICEDGKNGKDNKDDVDINNNINNDNNNNDNKDTKKRKAPSYKPESFFTFNDKFRSKLYKIRVGTMTAQKENPEQQSATLAKVNEDRNYIIDATIVRVMKSRKTLAHSGLVAETIKLLQARFTPSPLAIKKRIEYLMEKEYLERSKTDQRVYNYLA